VVQIHSPRPSRLLLMPRFVYILRSKKDRKRYIGARETFPRGLHATILVKYKPRGIDDFSASSTPNSSSRNPRPSRVRNFSRPEDVREAERCPYSAAPVFLSHLGGESSASHPFQLAKAPPLRKRLPAAREPRGLLRNSFPRVRRRTAGRIA
jgi:hypothetical protein